jgi:bilin biosynthesis protein
MSVQTNIIRAALDQGIYNTQKLDSLIQSRGEDALDQLLLALEDEDGVVRALALAYLGKMGDKRAVPPLIHFIQNESRYDRYQPRFLRLRERIARRLSPWYRDTLKQISKDERILDFRGAAVALGKIGSPDAAVVLRSLSRDPEDKIRSAASEALARLGAT